MAIDSLDDLAPAAILAFDVGPRCLPPLRGREDRRPDRERALLGMQVLHSGPCAHIFRLDSRNRDARNASGPSRHRTLFTRGLIVHWRLDHHGVGATYTALLSVVQALK